MADETATALLTEVERLAERVAVDPEAVRPTVERFVTRARDAGDAEALVAALLTLAQADREVLRHHEAGALLDEAATTARRARLGEWEGRVLLARGALHHERGRPARARRDLDRAGALLGVSRAAEVDHQYAALAHNAGRLTEAETLYRRILETPGLEPLALTRAANNLGLLEATRGRDAEADRWLERAAQAAAAVGPIYVAHVAETRAWAQVQAGRLPEGVAAFEKAAVLWEEVGLPLAELHADYADALTYLRLVPEALAQAEQAARLLDESGIPLVAGEARLRVARLRALAGDLDSAERLAEDVVHQMRRQRRPDWAARATLVAVGARLRSGRPQSADPAAARRAADALLGAGVAAAAAEAHLVAGRSAAALGRRRAAHADWVRAQGLARGAPVLGRLAGHVAAALDARQHGDDHGLVRACRSGLTDLAEHRSALPTTELRALASGHGSELAQLGLGALVRTGRPAAVLEWMEATRAAALATPADRRDEHADAELAVLRAVYAELAEARRQGSVPPGLLDRLAATEQRVRRATWGAARRTGRHPVRRLSTTDLRTGLSGRILVEYDILDGELLAVVVEPRRVRLVQLGPWAPVEAEVDGLRQNLRALAAGMRGVGGLLRDVAEESLRRLRQAVVDPLGLPEAAGLVVVPVGELQRVPWSALTDGPVSISPSAALWSRTASLQPAEQGVLLAAGPALASAGTEVDAVADVYRAAGEHPTVLTPPASSVAAVIAALSGARVAHLACHATVRADNPTFSSVLLADGSLTLHELDQRATAPHQLVLAACDVGSGVTYPGNETLGFVGTVLSGGTAGLVACTVLVPDRHVTPIMVELHRGLAAGERTAESLHQARRQVDPRDPDTFPVWCAFAAYGGG